MNETEKSQSWRARASTEVLSGASTKIRHVISNELDVTPVVA